MNPECQENYVSRHVLNGSLPAGEILLASKCCHKVLSSSKGRLPGHDKGRVTTEPITQRLLRRRPGTNDVIQLAVVCSCVGTSPSNSLVGLGPKFGMSMCYKHVCEICDVCGGGRMT